ncbi:hypothetical protein FRUB_04837 [Fimbriiglobus ruber]|uniref:Uncharacterized protein n=1 Tax=Fimbriiglobus ruber TaxID=1908690 RepID=A0A225DX91_9BACT|nr:hypothetical protein FRUB_04837 [Fimbriiglobus ruber]
MLGHHSLSSPSLSIKTTAGGKIVPPNLDRINSASIFSETDSSAFAAM